MLPLTSLKQLHYRVALSEQLNFTRAAASCFVTQSTLSAGLKELENVLGARLVERDRQTALMTPTRLEVAKRACEILAATKDLVEIAAYSRAPWNEEIRMGGEGKPPGVVASPRCLPWHAYPDTARRGLTVRACSSRLQGLRGSSTKRTRLKAGDSIRQAEYPLGILGLVWQPVGLRCSIAKHRFHLNPGIVADRFCRF